MVALAARREGSGRQLEPDHAGEDHQGASHPEDRPDLRARAHLRAEHAAVRQSAVTIDHRHAAPAPQKEGQGFAQQEYFTGYIGQMGTQFDAFGHQGRVVRMADGTLKNVYYNGFTQEELTGANRGLGGLEALGVEHVKPIITRGILIDIAGYKGVPVLDSRYEVTLADVRGALAKQGISENSIEPGDAILFNYGWAVNWGNPQKYNDSRFFVGENQGSPGIGVEVSRWAVEKKASMVGADSCCVTISAAGQAGAGQRAPRAALRRRHDAREHGSARAGARPCVRVPVSESHRADQGRYRVARAADRGQVVARAALRLTPAGHAVGG